MPPFNQPPTNKIQTPKPNPQLDTTRPQSGPNAPQDIASKLPFRRVYYKTLGKGSLISFRYAFWKHDPTPLVLVTDTGIDRIRGINLRYLTYRYVRSVLQNYCGKNFFSYRYIMHDQFMVNAFRTYKRAGMSQIQMLDCDVLGNVLGKIRTFNPQELQYIQKEIQRQLKAQANPSAEEMAQQYQDIFAKQQPGFAALPKPMTQDARLKFRPQPGIGPINQ